jgi:hypothetical protein
MSAGVVSPARAVCVVRDPVLRRTLQRSLGANGTRVEFRESLHDGALAPDVILFIDHGDGDGAALTALTRTIGDRARVVMLGGSLGDGELVSLLREHALDHVISDRGTPDELELAVTSAKLHSGDIFGLEKYLAWGAAVMEIEVASYDEKCAALDQLGRMAERVGARRRLMNRIQSTADELLMNALYDAPAAARARLPESSQRIRLPPAPGALLRYACDGRYMAVSVLDRFGALDKRAVLDSFLRARADLGRPRPEGGAGLGLYFVLSSVTRFIVNVQPGLLTEVVCLFDLRESGRDAAGWARSLHVFTAAD